MVVSSFVFLRCPFSLYIMMLVQMQYKCLLVKKVTKRILQTFQFKSALLGWFKALTLKRKNENSYPFYLIPQQGIVGMSQ